MIFLLNRVAKKETYTIGKLYVDEKYLCDTIEDKVRDLPKEKKVYGETAIPAGFYEMDLTFSAKFKRDLPLIKNVPFFDGIRIHRGNTAKDTEGCIIVGENKEVGKVINSTGYEVKIMAMLREAKEKGDKIFIQVV
jgi:hypothetical protein